MNTVRNSPLVINATGSSGYPHTATPGTVRKVVTDAVIAHRQK
jgi:hypothetical protein